MPIPCDQPTIAVIICSLIVLMNLTSFHNNTIICLIPPTNNHNNTSNHTAEEETSKTYDNNKLDSILLKTGGPYPSHVGHVTSRKKFLVYQPTGGFTNQKRCLSNAIKLAIEYDRFLVVPMIGKHSNLWEYLEMTEGDLIEADRIFDFDTFLKHSKLKGIIVLREPFQVFLKSLRRRFGNRIEEYMVGGTNEFSRDSQRKDLAQEINNKKIQNTKQVLLFSGYAMYNPHMTVSTARLKPELIYTPSIQKMAINLAQPLGMYHSIHARLGDYYYSPNHSDMFNNSDISFCCDVDELWQFWVKDPAKHTAITWHGGPNANHPSRSHQRPNLSSQMPSDVKTLYVATNPNPPREYFEPLCGEGRFDCYFSSDLDRDIMGRFYDAFGPDRKKLANDVFGVVEQVICANSLLFISTLSRSTFSKEIRGIRQFWPPTTWALDPEKVVAVEGDHWNDDGGKKVDV